MVELVRLAIRAPAVDKAPRRTHEVNVGLVLLGVVDAVETVDDDLQASDAFDELVERLVQVVLGRPSSKRHEETIPQRQERLQLAL
eukprot:1989553-Heterocapsa_arctica.AAC.1